MGLTSNTGPYNAAAEYYGVDDPVMVRTPRALYNFSLEFVLNENVFMEDDSFGRSFTFNRVASVGMPNFDYGVTPVNQYNRIRYIPTRMTPGSVSVMFYDTKDNIFQSMMKAYAGHYFNGHDLSPVNFSGYEMINNQFGSGAGHDFGAKTIPKDSRFFFEEIRIHNKDSAQGGRTTVLYNCMIETVQHTTFDYSASSSATYSVTFQPEHVNIGVVDAGLLNNDAVQQQRLQSTIPTTVSNRPPQFEFKETQTEYVGQNLKRNQFLRKVGNKVFVVTPDGVRV